MPNIKLILGDCLEVIKTLDPFMGRCPVGVACKEMNRNYIGIELDKFWYDKAVLRVNNAQEMML